ncbi:hypothetical protein EVAR_61834_1 [Eumeta japonica]|uniref:Uncharacterized protein n=1 Tax=Eumeta variegata TaxID=151549 RepID=A0A4C1YXN0_EUMVA|nr:hypothetical protein EVAR_61834_1 [Eumeta japonica]
MTQDGTWLTSQTRALRTVLAFVETEQQSAGRLPSSLFVDAADGNLCGDMWPRHRHVQECYFAYALVRTTVLSSLESWCSWLEVTCSTREWYYKERLSLPIVLGTRSMRRRREGVYDPTADRGGGAPRRKREVTRVRRRVDAADDINSVVTSDTRPSSG